MTTAFSAATTIGHPVGGFGSGWSTGTSRSSGCRAWTLCAPRVPSPPARPWSSRREARSAWAHRSTRTRAQHHAEVGPGRGHRRLHVRVCGSRSGHPREPGGRLLDDRSGATSRPCHQVRHAQGRRRPARSVRRHLRTRASGAGQPKVTTMPSRVRGGKVVCRPLRFLVVLSGCRAVPVLALSMTGRTAGLLAARPM